MCPWPKSASTTMAEDSFSDSDQRGITHFDPNLVESEKSDKAHVRVVKARTRTTQNRKRRQLVSCLQVAISC